MAIRQEQEEAREEITEVGPGVLRLELPIRMPGLGHVNCYALMDDDGVALMDPGLPSKASYNVLKTRLKKAGYKVKHVHTVLVTHSHPDHFGGARFLVKEAGAKLVAHRAFRFGLQKPEQPEVSVRDLAAQREAGADADHSHDDSAPGQNPHSHSHSPSESAAPASQGQNHNPWAGTTPWGGPRPQPPMKMRVRWKMMRMIGRFGIVPPVAHSVEADDVLRLAGRDWFVKHTPGHTEDHFCLHDPEEGLFLAGDHVLPTITPHISGLSTDPDPLAQFFASLDQVAAIPDIRQALPAHGHPFDDLAARCEAIKRHHDERLDKLTEIGRSLGPATVQAFSQRLFKERSWGAMAESETYAHLEHLRIAGKVGCHPGDDGQMIFEV